MAWILYIIGAILFCAVCAKVTHPCILVVTSLFWPFVVPVCLVMAVLGMIEKALNKKGEE